MAELEQQISRALALVLDRLSVGEAVPDDSPEFRDALSGIEHLLPTILRQAYDHWRWESIDGFRLRVARKTGPAEAECVGLAILGSDQTMTPVHLRLQICVATQKIVRLECELGEAGTGQGGLLRMPYDSVAANEWLKRVSSTGKAPAIDWVYRVQFSQ